MSDSLARTRSCPSSVIAPVTCALVYDSVLGRELDLKVAHAQEGIGRRLGGDGLDVDGDALSPGHERSARRSTARDIGSINSTSP